jgi:TolA-binding protein
MKPNSDPNRDRSKPQDPGLLEAAKKALMDGGEALSDFVLRAPTEMLERFSSPEEAAESIAGKPEPRAIYDKGLKAYKEGDFSTAAEMWTRAMEATDKGDTKVRQGIKNNIDIARSKEK